MAKTNNIEAAGIECLAWNCADTNASLKNLANYVEEAAQQSMDWYWKNKRLKAFFSQWTQFLAVVLTSAAAIVPIVGVLTENKLLQNPLWASLLVGLAAALFGLDRAFGFTGGWARYVLAATNIRKTLEEFRMDWTLLLSKTGPNPTGESLEALLLRAKEFRVAVEGLVLQETKDWVTEFQNNVARLEKDVAAQLATLKAQTEQAAQARAAASQAGLVQVTVPNADKADDAKLEFALEGADGKAANETLTGSKTWVRLNVSAGQYRVTVRGAIGGKAVLAAKAVIVKPGESAEVEVPLPE